MVKWNTCKKTNLQCMLIKKVLITINSLTKQMHKLKQNQHRFRYKQIPNRNKNKKQNIKINKPMVMVI